MFTFDVGSYLSGEQVISISREQIIIGYFGFLRTGVFLLRVIISISEKLVVQLATVNRNVH